MSKKCPECESKDIHITEYPNPTSSMATCYGCGYADLVERFPEQTVFDHITASVEVLAEKLVYAVSYHWEMEFRYTSNLIPGHKRFDTKSEAIAATVAKLKEVAVGSGRTETVC